MLTLGVLEGNLEYDREWNGIQDRLDDQAKRGSVESAFQGLASGMCRRTLPCCILGVAVYYHLFVCFFLGGTCLTKIYQDGFRQVLANNGLKPEGLASPEEAERVVGCSMGPLDICRNWGNERQMAGDVGCRLS